MLSIRTYRHEQTDAAELTPPQNWLTAIESIVICDILTVKVMWAVERDETPGTSSFKRLL